MRPVRAARIYMTAKNVRVADNTRDFLSDKHRRGGNTWRINNYVTCDIALVNLISCLERIDTFNISYYYTKACGEVHI